MYFGNSLIELGASLAGQDRLDAAEDDNEEMSTSGVSTVNSTKMKPQKVESHYPNDELSKLKMENVRLMQDLLESHKMYQALLKSTIDEQRLNLDLLRNFTTQLTTATSLYERSMSQGYFSDTSELAVNRMQNENLSLSPVPMTPYQNSIAEVDAANNNKAKSTELIVPRKTTNASTAQAHFKPDFHCKTSTAVRRPNDCYSEQLTTSTDSRLNDWLVKHHIDTVSRSVILAELFTFDDFVYGMEKSDLHRIGLK